MEASQSGGPPTKAALVVGGGFGIGRATARLLANQGVRLALVDLDRRRVETTRRELDAYGICAAP